MKIPVILNYARKYNPHQPVSVTKEKIILEYFIFLYIHLNINIHHTKSSQENISRLAFNTQQYLLSHKLKHINILFQHPVALVNNFICVSSLGSRVSCRARRLSVRCTAYLLYKIHFYNRFYPCMVTAR